MPVSALSAQTNEGLFQDLESKDSQNETSNLNSLTVTIRTPKNKQIKTTEYCHLQTVKNIRMSVQSCETAETDRETKNQTENDSSFENQLLSSESQLFDLISYQGQVDSDITAEDEQNIQCSQFQEKGYCLAGQQCSYLHMDITITNKAKEVKKAYQKWVYQQCPELMLDLKTDYSSIRHNF